MAAPHGNAPPMAEPKSGGGFARKSSMYGRRGSVGMEGRGISAVGGEDISRAPWYVGETERDDCDKAVCAANKGDFLVRLNSKGDKYVICVNDSGTPQNFQVCTQLKSR